MSALLQVHEVTKRFGGVTAVRKASLAVPRGGLIGLIGPNGAGKSTLVNLVSKHDGLDEGSVFLSGEKIDQLPSFKVAQAGLARTYQHARLFWDDTVEQNIHTAMISTRYPAERNGISYPGAEGSAEERTAELFDFLDLAGYARERPGNLNHVLQGRVELAQALALRPKVLLLDEPFAGLTPDEAVELEDLLKICQQGGLSMLVIDHNMQVVMKVLQYLYVMHHGDVIAEGTPEQVRSNEKVVSVYLKGSL